MLRYSTEYPEIDIAERREDSQNTKFSTSAQSPAGSEKLEMFDSLSEELVKLSDAVEQLRKEEFEMQKKMPKSSYAGKKVAPATSAPRTGAGSQRSKIPAPSQNFNTYENKHPDRATSVEGKTFRKVSYGRKGSRKMPAADLDRTTASQTTPESSSQRAGRGPQGAESLSAGPRDGISSGSPHFAQPTFAAAIRHESVRRKSTHQQGMTSPEGSPGKSTRSVVSQQRRRAPLPGAWTEPTVTPRTEVPDTESHSAAPAASELSVDRQTEQEGDREAPKQDHTIRKKTSTTYMSPTKATTLRNIATIGQENTKRTSPRISRSRPLSQVHTALTSADDLKGACSVASDSGSEKIITEIKTKGRPAKLVLTNPVKYVSPGSRSPTGIIPSALRRRMTVGVSVADVLAEHARSSAFPGVAHTTRKRRESTGDLLNPIRARLNKVGLLNGSIYGSDSSASSPLSTAMEASHHNLQAAPEEPAKAIIESKQAFQPPHRRLWVAKGAQEESAACAAVRLGLSDKHVPPPALRATAAEFTPMSKPASFRPIPVTPPNTVRDWDTALMFRNAAEWACLSPDDKRLIQAARHFQRTGGEVPGGKVARQSHWQTIMMQQQAAQSGPLMSYADVYGTGVVAGQILKPYPTPGMNAPQLTAQETIGEETPPIRFHGGSPSPAPGSYHYSPRRVPMSQPNSWSIGADASNQNIFGWTGGAGREIKFVGYGPDAERDPNTPVSFNFRGGNSSSNRNEFGPRMIGEETFNGSSEPPLAPRSKAQWAKLQGYTKVPCSDIDITHAVELLPVPSSQPLSGYCNDCAYSSH